MNTHRKMTLDFSDSWITPNHEHFVPDNKSHINPIVECND